jgi:hypothetical protein
MKQIGWISDESFERWRKAGNTDALPIRPARSSYKDYPVYIGPAAAPGLPRRPGKFRALLGRIARGRGVACD